MSHTASVHRPRTHHSATTDRRTNKKGRDAMSAPAQSQEPISELLAEVKAASGGRLLALHTDLARSPAALAAYLGLRRAGADYGKLDPSLVPAIMLTTGAVDGGAYSQAIATQLAIRTGMT